MLITGIKKTQTDRRAIPAADVLLYVLLFTMIGLKPRLRIVRNARNYVLDIAAGGIHAKMIVLLCAPLSASDKLAAPAAVVVDAIDMLSHLLSVMLLPSFSRSMHRASFAFISA